MLYTLMTKWKTYHGYMESKGIAISVMVKATKILVILNKIKVVIIISILVAWTISCTYSFIIIATTK